MPAVAAVAVTAWMFRSTILRGEQIGNIGDARWSVGLHEHWLAVWQGRESIRQLLYYYPLSGTLGTSEPFFLQGQFYSLARLTGLSMVTSWSIAQMIFFLLGALGVAALSRYLFDSVSVRVGFVLLSCASYPMIIEMGHPQLIGFLSASWILYGVAHVLRGRPTLGLTILVVAPILLAVSCWYALLLLSITLAIFGSILAILTPWPRIAETSARVWHRCTRRVPWPAALGLAVVGVLGWGAVAWIFLPGLRLLPAPEWFEVVLYSPRWSDLVNASGGGGGLWAPLYDAMYPAGSYNTEQNRGFTPILGVAVIVIGLLQLRVCVLGRQQPPVPPGRPGRASLIAALVAIPATLAFFVVDDRGLGLFHIAWSTIPAMESIRVPMRVQILLFGLAAFLVLRALELQWQSRPRQWSQWRTRVLAVSGTVLVLAVLIEMHRPVETSWTAADLLDADLVQQAGPVRAGCDAFILVEPSNPAQSWRTAVDAVILSAISGVPTPQGLSRADPLGYPGLPDDGTALVDWMKGNGFTGTVCRVSATGVTVGWEV